MAKALIVYDSKYGNTKNVAETIAEGMRQVPGVEVTVRNVKDTDAESVRDFDVVLIGSPNHIGTASRPVRKFIDALGKVKVEGKVAAVFDTYMSGDFEKAMKKMEKQLGEKAPGLKLLTPGLSIKVSGMEGPIAEGELPKCKEFGNKVAAALTTQVK